MHSAKCSLQIVPPGRWASLSSGRKAYWVSLRVIVQKKKAEDILKNNVLEFWDLSALVQVITKYLKGTLILSNH